ncbi:Uu.00g046350.m01.CDS01 [Anthostomella pinea]|uniref:Uu.00g046350.m01.CDS01 n=1 Tax=Anthostomella pinea TaxID=933095 RepID=A0AAI8YEI0_9PEZI|nr:Uu.00g046350.m01.CDS01 [Anthostomella pinea]
MLSSIGRAATKQLRSAAVVTSPSSIVVTRGAGSSSFSYIVISRSYATAGRPKGSTKSTKSTTVEKTKKATEKAPETKKQQRARENREAREAATKEKEERRQFLAEKKKVVTERRELRETALYDTEPKSLPADKWPIYLAQTSEGQPRGSGPLGSRMAAIAEEYKKISPPERQRLEVLAHDNKLLNAAAYKAWVESHTPQQIVAANKARKLLKTKYNIPKAKLNARTIKDERQPKRPSTPFSLFTKARWATGDYANHSIVEATINISKEWRALQDSERQPYLDIAKAEVDRYHKDHDAVLGREVSPVH